MEKNRVKILWSGITGRTGQEALEVIKEIDSAEIVAGVCRSNEKYYTYEELDEIKENDASNIIPIFRGGNFRFDVKKFIDDVVEYARNCDDNIELIETHYKTKKIPSETAKVIAKRVFEETGKEVDIKSFLEYDELINDWKVANLHCRVIGFKELAKDVLKIATMMNEKKPNGVYDLDRLLKEDK